MYQGCYRPGYEQLANRCCRPNMPEDIENDIDVERTNYKIEESINHIR